MVAYQDGAVVSKTVVDKPAGTVTCLPSDKGKA